MSIPFNRPARLGQELEYIKQAIAENMHISGDGFFSRQCEAFFKEKLGVKSVLLTPSCTDALEMAAILLELEPGDEVIFPSFTFVSTANAFVLHGANPVFVDVSPHTLNIDVQQLAAALTPRTRAIVVVHYAGVACDMDEIMALADQHGLVVIEDNAHGLFGTYKGRSLGTCGALATLSFHETKNFTCGEGGALLINDPQWVARAEVIRHKGTNRNQFLRGQVDKYTWVDKGASFLLSDLNAAYLYAQLEQWQAVQAKRRHIWETYKTGLADWAAERGVQLPYVPEHCQQSYHIFYTLMPSPDQQREFINYLNQQGVNAVFHYQPLHTSKMGQQFGVWDCPVTIDVSQRLVRLPFYYNLTDAEQTHVIDVVRHF